MPEGLPSRIDLVVPTDLVYVRPARKMVEGLLHAQGWEDDAVEEAALVVTELVQNAIEHGSRADGSETARVRIALSDTGADMEVCDPGTGKDPVLLLERDVTQPVPLDAARGRGLFLIHRLAERLERERTARDGGCCVRVRLEAR